MDHEEITKQIRTLFSKEVLELKINRFTMKAERVPSRGSLTPRQVIEVDFFATMLEGGVIKGSLELESSKFSGLAKQDKIKDILKKKKNNIEPSAFAEELKKI